MSLRKFLKRAGRRVGAEAKRINRKTAPARARIGVYATGVVATAASYFFTPAAGALVTVAGGYATGYAGATAARARGVQGRDARALGRKSRNRAFIAGAIGTTAGGIAGALAPLGYGTPTGVFGVGAAPVPSSAPAVVSISGDALPTLVPAPVAAALPSSTSGIVTAADLGVYGGQAAGAGGLTGVGCLDTGLTAVGGAALSAGGKALGGLLSGGGPSPAQAPLPQNTPTPFGAPGVGGTGSDIPGGSDSGSSFGAAARERAAAGEQDRRPLLYLAAAGLALALLSR